MKTVVRPVLKPPSINARFATYAERLNSRLSMVGFTWCAGKGLVDGVPLEFGDSQALALVATTGVLALATARTLECPDPEVGVWTREAENINGRLAMLGFLGIAPFLWPTVVNL